MPGSGSQRIVVTGATGFLGGAVARRLCATRPSASVLGLGRDRVRGAALQADGIGFAALDLTDAGAVAEILRGADVVVHAAALSSPWGARARFQADNVMASDHVAAGCVQAGVRRLVHISTPGIYHDGRSRTGIREDDPLPPRAVNHYVATKREAERRVLAMAESCGLPTLVLRPRAIFGAGDVAILPRLARALKERRLRRIGDGHCTVDMSYIDNVVDAVLLAIDAPARLTGRSYNISNGEPVRIWRVIDQLADALGVPRPVACVSRSNALWAARILEAGYRMFAPRHEPPLLRYGVDLLSLDMTLDISRARAELGYHPRIPMEEALARTFAGLARDVA
jgi:nucleoside-diphosphate-sugar epimerase